MRLIGRIDKPEHKGFVAKIYDNSEWGEFVVKYLEGSVLLPESTWTHTDKKQDAFDTAYSELRHLARNKGNRRG